MVFCSNASGKLIFYCPLCGVAWSNRPVGMELRQICSLRQVAPTGISLPSEDDLVDLRRSGTVHNVDYRTWREFLDPFLPGK